MCHSNSDQTNVFWELVKNKYAGWQVLRTARSSTGFDTLFCTGQSSHNAPHIQTLLKDTLNLPSPFKTSWQPFHLFKTAHCSYELLAFNIAPLLTWQKIRPSSTIHVLLMLELRDRIFEGSRRCGKAK